MNNPPGKAKKRDRSDTASSTRTGTTTRRSVDTISSVTPRRAPSPQAEQKIPGNLDSQLESSADEGTVSPAQPLRKIASGASLSALSPSTATTPSIPTVTPAIGSITDDSDTDFQSAYSTSPRDSYVSFDGRRTPHYHDSDDSAESIGLGRDYGKHVASQLTKSPVRERVSSTATAIQTPGEDILVSKGRVLTRA